MTQARSRVSSMLRERHFWGSPRASECAASRAVTKRRARLSTPSAGPPDPYLLSACSVLLHRNQRRARGRGAHVPAGGQRGAARRPHPAPTVSP